ncbi:PilN family type IVB pilus formation outer membrane protein [Methylophilus sp. QUAN]|uniref:PilN family type IVB pilus formation outer membrane protein n=1 Tax=Methylophilus sp. QUAN TaxID=2781020 RepID=UPI00188EF4F9|nr:PilN family type IVB pilus formation outer membrane protein [Methylophilus sp. QUAN]MBF4990978.1 PilN family type IVB pilus formation outer membrane protein [Methylophilus sp. QUAN]
MEMKKNIIALLVASTLAGCSTAAMKPIAEGVKSVEKEADVASSAIKNGKPLAATPEKTLKRSNSVWFPVTKVVETMPREAVEALKRNVAVNRRFMTLNETASYVTSLTGIPTAVQMTQAQMNASSQSGTTGQGAMGGMGNMGAMGGMNMAMNTGVPGVSNQMNNMTNSLAGYNPMLAMVHHVNYSGPISGLLDVIATRYNVNWEWDSNGGVRFFKTKTKTFRVLALPGDTSLTSKIGTSSSGGGASSGGANSSGASSSSQINTGVEFSGMSVWKGIEDSIKTMLTTDGKVAVTPATGTITVEDTPLILERVSKFVDLQNQSLAKQVTINVKVLAVDLTESNEYGVNWDAVYQNVSSSFGLALSNQFATTTGAPTLTYSVLGGGRWDGTKAMITALSQQGKVSQVTSASLVTINNQPAPLQVAKQTTYLASSTTTIGTAGAGNTVSLTPGILTTGFSMNILPHILDNDKMMLQYSGDISALIRLNTVTSGGSSIQTPEIDTRNFMQRVVINSGETLVVTGFEQFSLNGTTQGPVSAEAVSLGGGVNTKKSKSQLIVLIQPVIPGSK